MARGNVRYRIQNETLYVCGLESATVNEAWSNELSGQGDDVGNTTLQYYNLDNCAIVPHETNR